MFRSRNTKAGHSPRKDGNGEPPLIELRECVTRIDVILNGTCEAFHGCRTRSKNESPLKKSSSWSDVVKGNGDENTTGNTVSEEVDAEIVHFDPMHEEEMIELLRRIVELVARGEQRAAAYDGDLSAQIIQSGDSDNAIFEYFCEANVLSTIVNIVTGVSFIDDNEKLNSQMEAMEISGFQSKEALNENIEDDHINEDRQEPILLPPISIATQAIQSVSILIQNVARVTSLYILLSNNKVNDLIELPLERYNAAEMHSNKNSRRNNSGQQSVKTLSQGTEMSELTTHFISFLKSLAMRMNPETLQFYLTYPMHKIDGVSSIKSEIDFSKIQFPLYARALKFCSPVEDTFVRVTAMNICLNTLRLATFGDPLLTAGKRTLQESLSMKSNHSSNNDDDDDDDDDSDADDRPDKKISPDGSSLHRAKALPFRERLAISHYVCLPSRVETLTSATFTRLGQLCCSLEETIRSMDKVDRALIRLSIPMSNASKGASKKSKKEDTISNKGVDSALLDIDEKSKLNENQNRKDALQIERIRVVKQFQDLVADFQDEFLLLEDLLSVGLVPLNEQIIEFMFATVVYPLVLQPLQLYTQRHKSKMDNKNPDGNNLNNNEQGKSSHHLPADSTSDILGKDSLSKLTCHDLSVFDESPSSYDNHVNKVKTNNIEPDASLAKTALFIIGSIYHLISHKPLLHLLLTALFHPLAPEASNGLILTEAPVIVQSCENGDMQIKTDELQNGTSLDCYMFGRISESSFKGEDFNGDIMSGTKLLTKFTYVLSPALAQLYQAEDLPQNVKPNSYRRSILSCLSGTDGMSSLQPLAIYAMDAVFATVHPEVQRNILFGANIRPEWDLNQINMFRDNANNLSSNKSVSDNCMVEVIASMCISLMTATISSNGLWCLNFNLVASHAICCATLNDKSAKSTALKLIDHRRRESASFMSQTPSRLKKKKSNDVTKYHSESKTQSSDKISIDDDLKMDRIFFDPFCDGDKFAVENIVRKHDGSIWNGPAYISVAKDGGMNGLSEQICSDPTVFRLAEYETEEASYRCGANSAVAHLQLDTLTKLLRDDEFDFDKTALEKHRGYLGVAEFVLFNKNCIEGRRNKDHVLLSPLSPPYDSLLFDDDTSSDESHVPRTGDVVTLVGRAAYPCVCEVTEDGNELFTDRESSVVSDGIKWQSLWMVLMGKYMILAEPVKKDSGGNGRVVTSCQLSSLVAEKDESAEILQSPSPARRLLLTHFSLKANPPGLFVINISDKDEVVNNDDVQITRSGMDLWFEDSTAAAKALKALCSRIVKARSRRGHKIREALAQDDRLRFQSLINR